MKTEPHTIPEDFCFTEATRGYIEKNYPQLDVERTEMAFLHWGTNAIETNKRHPKYGQPLECKNWQMKAKNVIDIQMENKWTTVAKAKQGQEVDIRWREILAHRDAIGCPLQRTPADTADGFRTRVKNWEANDSKRKIVQFELKQVMK